MFLQAGEGLVTFANRKLILTPLRFWPSTTGLNQTTSSLSSKNPTISPTSVKQPLAAPAGVALHEGGLTLITFLLNSV